MSNIPRFLRCPNCGSDDILKNGTTRRGKQNYKCRDCGRQFVEKLQWKRREPDSSAMIDRLLLEKIPLAGIARVLKLSESWLQQYVNAYSDKVPRQVQVTAKPKTTLSVQMDELWSFVDDQGNKQWVWLALDVKTREIVGCHIGDRSADSALALWQSMPAVYRQCAMIYSDHWEADKAVLPGKRHRAVGKETELTSYIETARQVTGRNIPVVESDRRPGDPPILVGSSDKARQVLDWQPQYADLHQILHHAWQWHQKQHGAKN